MHSTILGPDGNPAMKDREYFNYLMRRHRQVKASYDAASTTSEAHIKHWQNADYLSPDAANRPSVRRYLRSRSRYELVENNAYLLGTVRSVANDFVGSGPSLKITDPRISIPRKRYIERLFTQWLNRSGMRYKLIQMKLAKIIDGETFVRAFTNPMLRTPVKLDFQVLEAERVSTETELYSSIVIDENREVDGITFDPYGNPDAYFVLESHPGAENRGLNPFAGIWVDSRDIIHWFRKDRNWKRGIPEMTASLHLCALLRRYTLATVKAAEVAANFSAVLESEIPPTANMYGDADVDDDPFDTIPISQAMMVTLPWGYKMHQFDAKQPMAHYDMFVDSLLREIVRPLLVPFNYAAGSSNGANMSSQTIDIDLYSRQTNVDRLQCNEVVMDTIADLWWQEATLIPRYLDAPLPADQTGKVPADNNPAFLMENPSLALYMPDHKWGWDPPTLTHTDPEKVAQSYAILHERKIVLDRDIQEKLYNRSYEEWQEEVTAETEFRRENEIDNDAPEPVPTATVPNNQPSANK